MAAQKLCVKNESAAENAIPVRQLQSPSLVDACRSFSTEDSEENEDCTFARYPRNTQNRRKSEGRGTMPLKLKFLGIFLWAILSAGPLVFRIDRKMFVLETLRDPFRLFHFDLFSRGIQLLVRFPAFCGAAHVSGGMS